MNVEQLIAKICKEQNLPFTLADLDSLVKLCTNYVLQRNLIEDVE